MQKRTKKVVATAMLGVAGIAMTPAVLHQVTAKAEATQAGEDANVKGTTTASGAQSEKVQSVKVTAKATDSKLRKTGAVDDQGYLTKEAAQKILTDAVKKPLMNYSRR